VYRTSEELNRLGLDAIKSILRNGVKTTGTGGRFPNGWVTYTLPNGNAASWHFDGRFIGFRGFE
jgi:filamentous hemagglutinin